MNFNFSLFITLITYKSIDFSIIHMHVVAAYHRLSCVKIFFTYCTDPSLLIHSRVTCEVKRGLMGLHFLYDLSITNEFFWPSSYSVLFIETISLRGIASVGVSQTLRSLKVQMKLLVTTTQRLDLRIITFSSS